MEVHERIKSLREERQLTQSDLADRLGMSYQSYWKIENGKTELTITRLNQIASILNCTIAELMGFYTKDDSKNEDQIRLKQLEAEVQELNKDVKGLLLGPKDFVRREHFWLNGGSFIISKMISKGIELGLFDEVNYKNEVNEDYIARLYMRRIMNQELQTPDFQGDLMSAFPEDKLTPILDEMFEVDWFKLIVCFLPHEDKLRERLSQWETEKARKHPNSKRKDSKNNDF
jgi:transcriptional regulator with XRE-family HTH domain